MPPYLFIELGAIILHCIYAFVSFGIRGNANVNMAATAPFMQAMFCVIAILYLAALIASLFEESAFSILICIGVAAIGATICYTLVIFGLIAAVLGALVVALLLMLLFFFL